MPDRFHIVDHGFRRKDFVDMRGVQRRILAHSVHQGVTCRAFQCAGGSCVPPSCLMFFTEWGTRVVLPFDSSVWMSAKTKGRSSSSLNSVLRRCAVTEFSETHSLTWFEEWRRPLESAPLQRFREPEYALRACLVSLMLQLKERFV